MDFVLDASETLATLLQQRGETDPLFRRMLGTYRDVADLLGRRAEFERAVAGLRMALAREAICA